MINYSIYPAEDVFVEWDSFNPEYEQIKTSDGITLMVERLDSQQVKILRVMSTDPQVFLREDLTPGAIIKTSLQI